MKKKVREYREVCKCSVCQKKIKKCAKFEVPKELVPIYRKYGLLLRIHTRKD
jgi:hypothetical protein